MSDKKTPAQTHEAMIDCCHGLRDSEVLEMALTGHGVTLNSLLHRLDRHIAEEGAEPTDYRLNEITDTLMEAHEVLEFWEPEEQSMEATLRHMAIFLIETSNKPAFRPQLALAPAM
ncbi:hypothetical protein [Salipiger sp. PrR003]|uniref:hypothetical protein n=1 Tax=Salipiger sp. PrR003 TaxID=2706776 RepID=UPI0013DA16FA|nr:hypothetical protein [Salipiger sp. PrR003]NDV50106.1 hypothetical protein [Salipiger sp. PrR003]